MSHKDLSKMNDNTPEEHLDWYAEFVKHEMLCGGPDSHLVTSGLMTLDADSTLIDKIWMGGCYTSGYNAPTASVLWSSFSSSDVITMEHSQLADWLTANRKGIHIHRHRRCVYSLDNYAKYLQDYALWSASLIDGKYYDVNYKTGALRYKELWDESTRAVKFLGRYSCFKLLEFYREYCDMPLETPDIRPKDGWSPRQMLSILYPEYSEYLLGKDNVENITVINDLADELLCTVHEDYGLVDVDLFHIQVFLCEYKQCYFNQKQYPGKGHDSELEYHDKLLAWWEEDDALFMGARADNFPHWALGEYSGWEGKRPELGKVLREHGYMWSDYLYDYQATTDFEHPVRRVI